MILTFITALTCAIFCYLKRNVAVYLFIYGISVIVFSIAIDGVFLGFWDYMFVYDEVEITILNIYYWLILNFSFLLFFVLLNNKKAKVKISLSNSREVRRMAYLVSLISLFSATYNTLNAGNPMLLLSDSRAWELSFGRNVITNYLYFSHLTGLVLFGIVLGIGQGKKLDWLVVILLIFSSTLHGIKFTIIHAFLFFAFSYWISSDEKITKVTRYLSFALVGLMISFFLFARGGGVQGFFSYIVSASVNSLYAINKSAFYEVSSLSVLNPFSFIPIDKINERLIQGSSFSRDSVGFVLNDSFNLQHAITQVGFAFGGAFVLYSCLFAVAINYLRTQNVERYHKVFFLCMILNSIFLFFTAFDFYKTKLWFNFIYITSIYYFYGFIFDKRRSDSRREV